MPPNLVKVGLLKVCSNANEQTRFKFRNLAIDFLVLNYALNKQYLLNLIYFIDFISNKHSNEVKALVIARILNRE